MVYNNSVKQFKLNKIIVASLVTGLLNIFIFAESIYAADCEIIDMKKYDKELRSIINDWYHGIPYMRLLTEKYYCASVTVRNNLWRSLFSEHIEITAMFTDRSTAKKKFECEEKRLHHMEEFFL
ncbi:MAG: hypothetical protein A2Y97_02065 [Nitrospirae bacterium RBG_13_39_12]|nr:MAG: hypothetical protein A2Y97_02065 [Nitrospirae bacterium RBG_13_39_12]